MVWQKNGTPNTLAITGDTLSVDDLTAEDTSVLLCHALNSGTIDTNITFDNDTVGNYAIRVASDGGGDSTAVSQSNIATGGDAADGFHVYYTVNIRNHDKLLLGNKVDASATGVNTAPSRRVQMGKWANTTDQFTSVEFSNAGGGDFVADSNLSVLSDVVPIPETIGGWVELGRTTLGSAADIITVSGLSNKRYYMFLVNNIPSGQAGTNLRLGAGSVDSGSNYAYRFSPNGQQPDTTPINQTDIELRVVFSGDNHLDLGYIANLSDKEKLGQSWTVNANTAGADNAPQRQENVFKWVNTASSLDTISVNNDGSGDFSANSEIIVLGWDPDDIHSGNFWEELASVDLSGGAADLIDSGTFAAKKYLWVQLYVETTGGAVSQRLTFNSDTGINYTSRRSQNGAADNLGITTSNIDRFNDDLVTDSGGFTNMFIINNSATEKLGIVNCISQEVAGANNAPLRDEGVFKWDNTAAQITKITFTNNKAGDMDTKTILKVWGSD